MGDTSIPTLESSTLKYLWSCEEASKNIFFGDFLSVDYCWPKASNCKSYHSFIRSNTHILSGVGKLDYNPNEEL